MEVNKTKNFILKSKKIHGDIYDYSLVEYIGCKKRVKIICKEHGIFEQKPIYHLHKGCKKCVDGKKMMTLKIFLDKSKRTHGELYDYSLVEYIGCKKRVKIICKEHGIFEQTPDNHIRQRGCPMCDVSKKSNTNFFIIKSKKIHGTKYDYSLVSYTNSKKKIKIICKEHGIFEQTPNNHLKGQNCPICKKSLKNKTQDEFLVDCTSKHGDIYDYSLVEYIGCKKKVKIICKEHGIFEQKPNNHLNGQGCPICKNSKGENIILNYLKNNNIEYLKEFRFDSCKNKNTLPFDFFLPMLNMCIEFNGIQHYKDIEYFTRNSTLVETKIRDSIKKNYCEKNNINLLVIKYNDNIIEKLDQFIKTNYEENRRHLQST